MKAAHVAIWSVLLVAYFAIAGVVISGVVSSPSQAEQSALNNNQGTVYQTFSGTIERVDPIQRIVVLQAEGGKYLAMLFAVTDSAVLNWLHEGDLVIVELDEQGIVKKIVKITAEPMGALDPKI